MVDMGIDQVLRLGVGAGAGGPPACYHSRVREFLLSKGILGSMFWHKNCLGDTGPYCSPVLHLSREAHSLMVSSHQAQLDHRYVMERVEIAITLSGILWMNSHFLYLGKCVSLSLGCLNRVG